MQSGSVFNNPKGSTLLSLPISCSPKGYLPEIGQELLITAYQGLYNQIGKSFCNDLVFSKGGTPLIMTSNILPTGYQASGSRVYDTARDFWKAFTNVANGTGTVWLTPAGYAMNNWIQLDFPKQHIYGLTIYSNLYVTSGIGKGKISGYNSAFTDLFNINQSSYTSGVQYSYDLPKPLSLTKLKVDAYSTNGDTSSYCEAGINIYGSVFTSFYSLNHIYNTGDCVNVSAISGSLHTGLSENTDYYVRKTGTNNFTLHPTLLDATNNTNTIIPTAVGGECKIYKKGYFKLKDSRNDIYTNFIKY